MRMNWLFGRKSAQRAPFVVALLVLVGALFVRWVDPAALQNLRSVAFDTFQRIQPREFSPETPVRIVDVDEAALAAHGQWPWPRDLIAQLVDKLTKQGAAVIAFDVIFAEADRSSANRMAVAMSGFGDPEAARRAAAAQDNDATFAAAIGRSRVVAGFGFDPRGSKTPPRRFFGVAFAGDDPVRFLPMQLATVKSLDQLVAAAKGNGSVSTSSENAIVRRVPLMFRLKDQTGVFPSLAMEALRVAQEAGTYFFKSSGASREVSFGEHTGIGGTATDIAIQARQVKELKAEIAAITAERTGQSVETIERDADRGLRALVRRPYVDQDQIPGGDAFVRFGGTEPAHRRRSAA